MTWEGPGPKLVNLQTDRVYTLETNTSKSSSIGVLNEMDSSVYTWDPFDLKMWFAICVLQHETWIEIKFCLCESADQWFMNGSK